ncbi:hypothetical protein J5U18_06410 [Sphingobacteriaceae bacterium WQ 2009]|uniref:Dual-action HEIGH metallo-peptidase n=1 Tax=Rhinopithecimicrobium faecis TaxID=2820698 RepID=A0A8T4H8T2_9SPHI|nr:hypothetical protein [Sphingobacteriaceae bacterium WQ 2009]
MRKFVYLAIPFFLFSCQKDQEKTHTVESSSAIVKDLQQLGFNTEEGFHPFEDGYIVEYDIFLRPADIARLMQHKDDQQITIIPTVTKLNAGTNNGAKSNEDGKRNINHYRTREIVQVPSGNQPRVINLYAAPILGQKINSALGEAAERFNALKINLEFKQVFNPNEADIALRNTRNVKFLMSAGFPFNNNPYHEILVNTDYYHDQATRKDFVSTILHEIGHCIGFRHTDFMNRKFSCPRETKDLNEGPDIIGAEHIPGTPKGPEQNSWMLACSSTTDRPFSYFDIVALRQVYPL